MGKTISEALVGFDEDFLIEKVKKGLEEGEEPIGLVRELQKGMEMIGERFNRGDYFLGELLMSSDLFTKAMDMLEPRLVGGDQKTVGKIVVGTPKGDIHEIGKNIFRVVAKGLGFEMHDLGVDVPVDRFVEAVEEVKPQILGFSALLTTTFEPMKEVVEILKEKGLRENLKVIIGGGVTTETVREYVGADAQTTDVMDGLNQCRKFIEP
ncbi:MAG: cobalamin-binding protein [Proteobacteria bacterium]|nr:cobalamin-binding protein [Pseudomonadota bacterium]